MRAPARDAAGTRKEEKGGQVQGLTPPPLPIAFSSRGWGRPSPLPAPRAGAHPAAVESDFAVNELGKELKSALQRRGHR